MVNIIEIANKLEKVLNGTDNETIGYTRNLDYEFVVATEGFHLDHIYDKDTKKNFIPVFIGSLGGQRNPVKGLGEANLTIPVSIYYPVRFKNDFFRLDEYLDNCFTGGFLTWGSEKCVSNISISQYGEIENLDLKQFGLWVNKTYKKPIEVMGVWMSMTFNLYLSRANSSYVWGNTVTTSLSFQINSTTYTDNDVTFVEQNIQSNTEATSQQAIGETEVESMPFGTSYANSFSCYVKDNDMYKKILEKWFAGVIQDLRFTITTTILGKTYSRVCYCQSVNMPVKKGQLITVTFVFVKAIE